LPDGSLDITEEAAHSVRRIIHVADLTGRAIEHSLYRAVTKFPNVTFVTDAIAVDLLTLSHHSINPADAYQPVTCFGVYAWRTSEKRMDPIMASETMLCTGGLGQLFLHTTNPHSARGDGIAMAYRAGARL